MRRWLSLLAALLPAAAIGAPVFVDITARTGIDARHDFGDGRLNNIVESVGGGVTLLDYDGDGRLDIYLVSGSWHPKVSEGEPPATPSTNHLYWNAGDGTFLDMTRAAGVGDAGYGTMAAAGDYDGDGRVDLYVVNFGGNRLYHNEGGGTFRDVTDAAGVGDDRFGVAATFFDLDGDGDLDLFVGNYVSFDPKYRSYYAPDGFPGPLSYKGQPDVLYRNEGGGRFEDVTAASGMGAPGRAMSAAAGDYDGDGDEDLFVANDAMENYLYRNDGGGRFTEIAAQAGVAYGENGEATSAMASCWGDVDGDGRPDLFISDTAFGSLYHNAGGGLFEDRAGSSGVAQAMGQYVSWGASLFDHDHDGDLDALVTNGALHFLYGRQDLLLNNTGGGRFADVAPQRGAYFERRLVGRGLATGDLDGDGDLDAVITNLGGAPVVLRNDGGDRRAWLLIRLVGRASNRDGYGARVIVQAGGQRQVRIHRAASGYLSQSDPRLHFGLGDQERAQVEVRWPSGKVQRLQQVSARQILTLTEPE